MPFTGSKPINELKMTQKCYIELQRHVQEWFFTNDDHEQVRRFFADVEMAHTRAFGIVDGQEPGVDEFRIILPEVRQQLLAACGTWLCTDNMHQYRIAHRVHVALVRMKLSLRAQNQAS